MKAICLISRWYFLVWYVDRTHPAPTITGLCVLRQVMGIWLFEKTPLMKRFTAGAVILNSEHPMPRGTLGRLRIRVWLPAMGACAPVPTCWPLNGQGALTL